MAARVSSRRLARRSATVGSVAISIFCWVSRSMLLQQSVLARLGERDRGPFAPGPAGAPDPMDVASGADGTS